VDRLLGEAGLLRSVGGGVEAGVQRVEAGALSQAAPRTRHDFGAFGHAGGALSLSRREVSLSAEARADRDGVTGDWFVSRALAAATAFGPLRVQLANRSAFTPPSLGDQFFREGVGVVPNPDLRPERVPSEWEASAQYARTLGRAELSLTASAFTGDVKGMIVWLPDFAFRWSPRNLDVTRRGVDGRAEAHLPAAKLRVAGAWSLARITWIREGDDTGIQVAYRPRHSWLFTAQWAPGAWRTELAARYTGERYPVPDAVNELPGFWSADLRVERGWRLGRWSAVTAVDVDRIFDEKHSLIAGYPEPGRRVRFDLRLSRADLHQP
jgi:outer membrane cobalamin receptor